MNYLQDKIKDTIALQFVSFSDGLIPVDIIKSQIRKPSSKYTNVGDYQFNLMYLFKYGNIITKQNSKDLADKWVNDFVCDNLVEGISNNGCFINFKINRLILAKTIIEEVIEKKDKYGYSTSQKNGLPILVEYSSPNIAKPFHMGHLRSTIIGNFLKNLSNAMGYPTVSINYIGDWGKQYGLLALAFDKYGDEEKLAKDPMKHMYEIYVAIHKKLTEERLALGTKRSPIDIKAQDIFEKLESKDKESLKKWKMLRDLSIKIYQETYQRLGIKFDVYSGESQVQDHISDVVKILNQRNLLQTDEKGTFIDLTEYKLGHAVILKSNQTTLYLSRDLAEINRRRKEWNFYKCFYVVGGTQAHHFKQFFKILELVEYDFAGKCQHVGFGQVSGMSTRQGTAVFLTDILDYAQEKMLEVMKENPDKISQVNDPIKTADLLGISAVIIQDLGAKREENYTFDWKRISSFRGNTGPYLQYSHARICSILRKVKGEININFKANLEKLQEIEAYHLIKMIGQYQNILEECWRKLEPHSLVEYLMDLTKAISSAYNVLRVKGEEIELAEARLLLFWCSQIVLASGMKLLGLTPIEAM